MLAQLVHLELLITKTNTVRSLRVVLMSGFLVDKVKEYIEGEEH